MTAPTQEKIGPGRLVIVVGPSGAGKDTIIAGTKSACNGNSMVVFPRRVVTRPTSSAEEHDSLDEAAFDQAVKAGSFSFWWQAHGLKYGIQRSVEDDSRAGRTIVCNISRAIVVDVRARFANVLVVVVTAPPDILAARLAGRSRGSDGKLELRIKRNDIFADFEPDLTINNAGAPESAVRLFLEAINSR